MGLVLPQTVTLSWTNSNKDHFIKKGYIFTKIRDSLSVNVLDLSNGSQVIVKIECDSCREVVERTYRDYCNSYCVSKVGKYFCKDCYMIEMRNHGILTELYWGHKENILNELKMYIQEHGDLRDMHKNKRGCNINSACNEYKYKKSELCKEIGYDYDSMIGRIYPVGYYMDYDNYKQDVRALSIKLGRTPKMQEILKELHIGGAVVNHHGGIANIYDIIPDEFNNSLKDDNGFFNRSTYEYMVAQYLIHNNIKYSREQHPFPRPYHRFKSDFTFEDSDDNLYNIEVWGYYNTSDKSKRAEAYRLKKELKINLYEECNINLISIDGKMLNTSYDNIQKYLFDTLSPYFGLDFKNIDTDILASPRALSEDELYKRVMKYSSDVGFTPGLDILNREDSSACVEVTKRYGGVNGFAKKYGLLTYSKKGFWDKDLVFKIMNHMYDKYGMLIKRGGLNKISQDKTDVMLNGFINGVNLVYPSIIDAYLDFYMSLVDKSICLKDDDLKYLNSYMLPQGFNYKNCTPERIQIAHDILDKNKQLQEKSAT